jgi:hypothetical protein
MGSREYIDFDLQIESADFGYRARVINSPVGQATTEFELPLSDMELENFILKLNRPRRGVRRIESQQMEAAKELGGVLYNSVFQGEVSSLLQSSLVEADKNGSGLRIRLRLSGTPELLDLPWEFLYNRSLNRFLSLSVDSPLVRYLDMPGHIPPLEVKPPLRVLVMISSPQDVPALDTEEEWRKLKDSVADLEAEGLMVLDRLEKPTLGALQHALRREDYHIFHFIGHGGFDEVNEDGILLLEDEYQRSRQVSGQDLGIILHDEKTLRLAVLNSCEGGRTSRTDPFVGVGQSLLQQGIPAVIAMQFEISDEAAIKMSHEFYYALADGYPVDGALAEARKGIFAEVNDVEWGTPVLYLRSSDGRIFDVDRKATVALPRTEPDPSDGAFLEAPSVPAAVAGVTAAVSAAMEPVAAAVTPAVQPQPVSTGQTRTASPVAATPAPAAQAARAKGGAGSRTKLWLGLGALLAVFIIGGGIFLLGGLGGSPDGNLPDDSAEGSVALPVGGAADETATEVADNTPTTEATIAPTEEPIELAAIAEENSTTSDAVVEPSLEPTDLPEPTLEPTDLPEPTPVPTDPPEPTPVPTEEPEPTAEPTVAPEPTAVPTKAPPPAPAGADFGGTLAIPLVLDFEPTVYITGLDGKGVNTKGVEGLPGSEPMFSRDGKTLILNGTGERVGLISANAQGTDSRVILDQDSALWPVLSPDGAVVSFVDTSVNDTIFKLQGDGSRSEVRANGTPIIGAKNLLWSDDNRLVFQGCAFWAGQAGECGTFVSDAQNVNPQRIIVGNSAWPSDARKGLLAYMSAEDGDWDIFVVSLNGGEPRNVTANNAQDGLPAIAPDGKSLAYLSNQSGTWAVWTINLSNGEKKKWFDISAQAGTVNGDTWHMDRMSWTK